ncbi:MAG: hypothetical protein HY513_00765 [Candidatus Aenigmarchaeota archaeon]|nr:hypothetical protein [Candidatus Aenigmarchaeota archaeon]
MVRLEHYGTVLDPTIELVEELADSGEAELRVPLHPEAVGMAIDIKSVLRELYKYHSFYVSINGYKLLFVAEEDEYSDKAKKLFVKVVFEKGKFNMPSLRDFASYPSTTILDIKEEERNGIDFKTRVSIDSVSTPEGKRPQKSAFMDRLAGQGVKMPPIKNRIRLKVMYQSISSYPIPTNFQNFPPMGTYDNSSGEMRFIYPVSLSGEHRLSKRAWELFQLPAFWDGWSSYSSIAVKKMSGEFSYEDAAKSYSTDPDTIERHSKKAERTVGVLIDTLRSKKSPFEVAYKVGCPPEYMHLYLRKIMRTIRHVCNPSSLADPQKRAYLENLSKSCADYGVRITAEDLARLPVL